ncbi:MAG: restriction endonuclease subunit S [Blastocatellia bacterium]
MHYLKDIATIRSGYLFREKIESAADGAIRVIQVGDITPEARLTTGALTRIHLPEIKSNQFLEPGDCLFISRGPRKQAVALTEAMGQTIATSQFFIIHPDESVLPEFLAWYINQRPAQRYIEAHSRGSAVSLINLDAMKMLPVEAPPVEMQRRIVQIHELSLRERELLEAIRIKRRALVDLTLLKAVSGTTQ